MVQAAGIGGGATGPWYRVQAISSGSPGGTADRDYASILPAALNAAAHRRPFIAGWLSRGGGAPLELITNAGPLPAPAAALPGPADLLDGTAGRLAAGLLPETGPAPGSPQLLEELLFPWGARGLPVTGNLLADLDRLVWAPCPGRLALPEPAASTPALRRAHAVRGRAADPDGPAVRVADRGRPDGPDRRRDRRAAVPAERAAPV